jgi:hypothetical protein
MLALLKEVFLIKKIYLFLFIKKFETSNNPSTFTIRFDCPGFSLKPFNVENTNTGEVYFLLIYFFFKCF